MTGSDQPIAIILSDNLSAVTHHYLLTRVPIKLDIDNWNNASWVYFFENLCKGYAVLKYIHSSSDQATMSLPTPLTPKELKVDTVYNDTVKAWYLTTNIFKDNKRSRTITWKAELRSLKLGDLSIDAYFRKIESIAIILTILGSPVSSDDVVTFALEGLPDKYENVFDISTHREPFLDLKTTCFLLTTEEMRLKYKSQALPVDSSSSSHMILLAESGNTRRSSAPQVKSWRSCYNFAKGSCRFGTIQIVLSLATSPDWLVHQLDVKNAFLYGDLSKMIYMSQPLRFRDSTHPDYVCLLQRSLYRIKLAPGLGFSDLHLILLVLGFIIVVYNDTVKAWYLTTDIFKDNKWSRTITLKAELRSLKLGDLSIDAYFRKIESIAIILTSLGSPVSSDDVVTFALEGLSDKYENVFDIGTHREPFLDLKTACFLLTTEEMRLKYKSQALPVDSSSSSHMILLAESGNTRRSSAPQVKSWRSCYNFAKGSCRFGNACKFVHDDSVKA
nr:hybrid signal transduction histidine kinase M [Tanacetum cinerariifolium]